VAGEDEFAKGVWQVKNLAARSQVAVAESELVTEIRKVLGG
jgi:histidyl-tRNA synthetase